MARRSSGPGQARIGLAILLFLGTLVLFVGFINGSSHSGSSIPVCDGQQMSPGDVCEITDDSGTVDKTYDQMQQDLQTANQNAPLELAGSVICLIAGISFMVSGVKASQAARRTPPPFRIS